MSKPRNRKEWRVLLDLLRVIRTATNEQREIMLKLWGSQVYKSRENMEG